MEAHLRQLKRATVALVLLHESREGVPFTIAGSGFCIDPRGVVVTCSHVLSAFMKQPIEKSLADAKRGEWDEPPGFFMDVVTPHVLFFLTESEGVEMVGPLVRPASAMAKTSHDIGMLRLNPHPSFPDGFPYVSLAPYASVHEGMEVGACGFPFGNYLSKEVGAVGSSFTKGILSSVIPIADVQLEYLKGFQLNLFATHGSSGGPAFLYSTGEVFGAIESNVIGPDGKPVQGLVKAAPIYPLLEHQSVERMLGAPPGKIPV
jgi:S1-C subfamily serine protease